MVMLGNIEKYCWGGRRVRSGSPPIESHTLCVGLTFWAAVTVLPSNSFRPVGSHGSPVFLTGMLSTSLSFLGLSKHYPYLALFSNYLSWGDTICFLLRPWLLQGCIILVVKWFLFSYKINLKPAFCFNLSF